MKKILATVLLSISVYANAMIGNTNNGTTTDTIWNATTSVASIRATRFQAVTNEMVSVIYAQIVGMTGQYKCAVYKGNATAASTFLRGTLEVINPTNGWYAFPLTSGLSLTNGQYYYLAIWGNASSAAVYSTSGGKTVWRDRAYVTNWPSSFTQGGTNAVTYSIYAVSPVTNPPVTYPATNKVTLAWDSSPDASVVGYKLYLGPATSGYTNSVTVGNVTNAVISNLVATATYYFAATAYDGTGLESDFSNETSYTVPSPTLPTNSPPAMLQNFRFF